MDQFDKKHDFYKKKIMKSNLILVYNILNINPTKIKIKKYD